MERRLTGLDLQVLSIITKYGPITLSQICKKVKKYSRQAIYSSVQKLVEIGLVNKINNCENPLYEPAFDEVYVNDNENMVIHKLPDGGVIILFAADEPPLSVLDRIKKLFLRK